MKKKIFIVQLLDSKKPSRTSFTQVEDALFYSNDTDASLVFIPHEDTFDFQSAKVVMFNLGDESLVERDMQVTTEDGREVASYELPAEIISHWGEWIAQPVFISGGEIYSGAIVPFSVERHLMHERPPKLTEVVTVTKFVEQSQELVNAMIQAEAQRIAEEQVRQESETNRVQAESERSVKYASYTQQFNNVITDLSEEKDYHSLPEISAARGGENTLGERLDKEHNEVTTQLAQNEDKLFHNSLVNHKSNGKFITIIDDDADKGFYTKLAPIARSYGIPLTSAVITHNYDGTMETPPRRMTLEQMHELNDEGFEFISHSYSHKRLTDESDEVVIEELTKSQKFIKEQGFNHRAFVYPTNREDERIHNLTRQYYDIAFSGYHDINRHPINQMAMRRVALELSLDGILSRIEEASEANTWLTMICHVDQGDWFTESKFRTIIEKALSEGFEFVTVEEGVKRKGNLAQFGSKTIDSDGVVYGGDIKVAGVSEYTGNTPPTDFPTDAVTIQKVRNRDLEDWGLGDLPQGGLVLTYKDSEDAFTFQKFIPSVQNNIRPDDILYRTWAPDVLIWRDWSGHEGNDNDDKINWYGRAYVHNKPISDYQVNKITKENITIADSTQYGLSGGGMLLTIRDSDETLSHQKFVPVSSPDISKVRYRRWQTWTNSWGPFLPAEVEEEA